MGIWTNFLFVLTLLVRPLTSATTSMLLRNQSLYDLFVCICTFLTIILPTFVITTNNDVVDFIVCNLWNTQYIHYMFIMTSTQNVVCTTADRYFAVMRPFSYRANQRRYVMAMYAYCLVLGVILPIPRIFYFRMVNNTCFFEKSSDYSALHMFENTYCVLWAVMIYFFPTVYFCVVYWIVIKKMKTLVKPSSGQNSDLSHVSMSRNVTIAIFLVTAVYVIVYTIETVLNLLDQFRIIPSLNGTPLGGLKTFIITINSMINPEMYFCLMKQIRYRFLSLCMPRYIEKFD